MREVSSPVFQVRLMRCVVRAAVAAQKFSATLLDGVTGAGKTEVYCEAGAAASAQGKQVLILLPEIALTVQFLDRFAARFGAKPAEWHSGVSPRKRARIWRAAATGDLRVVAGARSEAGPRNGLERLLLVELGEVLGLDVDPREHAIEPPREPPVRLAHQQQLLGDGGLARVGVGNDGEGTALRDFGGLSGHLNKEPVDGVVGLSKKAGIIAANDSACGPLAPSQSQELCSFQDALLSIENNRQRMAGRGVFLVDLGPPWS